MVAMGLSDTKRADLIKKFREWFRFADEGEKPQRDREVEDLQFQVPDMQWDADAKASRAGRNEGGIAIFPRPMLSVPKLDQPIRLVMSRARGSKLGINIHPVSETASEDTARILQGLIRRIERDSNANVGRLWALDRAVKAGRGVYRIVVRPDEDGFNYGDLEIGIERILHQGSVLWDPSAQLPDYSDGDFAYVTSWMLASTAARKYPSTRIAEIQRSGIGWGGLANEEPLWVRETGAGKTVQVAECFWKEHKAEGLLILDNGKAVKDESGSVPNGRKVIAKRERDRVTVKQAVTDGFDILEDPNDWHGKYIPLIPVLGRELQTFDEQRRIIGIIRNARDPQRFYNTSVSTLVERMFMEPRAPWVGPEGFDEGREREWAQANYLNIPVLRYKPTTVEGQVAPAPVRTQVDSQGMSIALLGVQQAERDVQEATAYFDPSLGKTARQDESGRKVLALQSQGDAANDDWLDNLAVAMRYEGIQLIDLIAPVEEDRTGIYDAPGRITTVLAGESDKAEKIMVNRPYVMDPTTGRPQDAPQGAKNAKHVDLRSGARYGVSIEVGQSFKTRLQEADETTTRIVEAEPQMLMLIGDLLFRNKDFPGKTEIADRLEAFIRAQHPEMFKDEQDGPEQIAAKAKALEGQVQQMTQVIQKMQQDIDTKRVEVEAKGQVEIAKAQIDAQSKAADIASRERIAEMTNSANILMTRMKLGSSEVIAGAELEEERFATGLKIQAEAAKTVVEQQHETRLQHQTQAHDVGMAAGGGNSMTRHVEQGQETGSEHQQEQSQGGSQEATKSAETQPQADGSGD